MTRMQNFNTEVKQAIKNNIRLNMIEPNMIDASICNDFDNELFSYSWSDFKIASGKISISKWIKDKGFEKCKKSEATLLLRVGERCQDSGYWIIGKCNNYWLRPI